MSPGSQGFLANELRALFPRRADREEDAPYFHVLEVGGISVMAEASDGGEEQDVNKLAALSY